MQIGESFVDEGKEAAHVNAVSGERSGPVGAAWAPAPASPPRGHAPFVAVVQPGLPVLPPTLLVNKSAIRTERHAEMTRGAAQAGGAAGVADAVADEVVARDWLSEPVLIVAVRVGPSAADAKGVFEDNRTATRQALRNGKRSIDDIDGVLAARSDPGNLFYRPR